MIQNLFDLMFSEMVSAIGNPEAVVVIIMALFFVGFLFVGLDFDFASIIISPIPYAFYQSGYLSVWITAIFIIIPLGTGIYLIWLRFNSKS